MVEYFKMLFVPSVCQKKKEVEDKVELVVKNPSGQCKMALHDLRQHYPCRNHHTINVLHKNEMHLSTLMKECNLGEKIFQFSVPFLGFFL